MKIKINLTLTNIAGLLLLIAGTAAAFSRLDNEVTMWLLGTGASLTGIAKLVNGRGAE